MSLPPQFVSELTRGFRSLRKRVYSERFYSNSQRIRANPWLNIFKFS